MNKIRQNEVRSALLECKQTLTIFCCILGNLEIAVQNLLRHLVYLMGDKVAIIHGCADVRLLFWHRKNEGTLHANLFHPSWLPSTLTLIAMQSPLDPVAGP